jgi:hypothetical protein
MVACQGRVFGRRFCRAIARSANEGALSVALELPGAKDTARWMMAAMEGH